MRNFKTIALTAGVLIFLFIGFYAFAWSDPTVAPPQGNTPSPINVGATTQTKSGGLNIMEKTGIGTAAPETALHVKGDNPLTVEETSGNLLMNFNNNSTATTKGTIFNIQKNGNSMFQLGTDFNGNGTNDFFIWNSGLFNATPSAVAVPEFYLSSVGNVGIGTTNPFNSLVKLPSKLHVTNPAGTLNAQAFNFDQQDQDVGIGMFTVNEVPAFAFNYDVGPKGAMYIFNSDLPDLGVGIQLYSAGDSYFAGGDLGVGTTNPEATFEVGGSGGGDFGGYKAMTAITSPNGTVWNMAIRSQAAGLDKVSGLYVVDSDTHALASQISDPIIAWKLSSGNVGIKTFTPQSELQVKGYVQLDLTAGAPGAADCDDAGERGRMKVDSAAGLLYICVDSGWVSK